MVEPPHVQQACIALHLDPLKTAWDLRQIICRIRCPLQDSALLEIDLHVAVQPQRPGAIYARREVHRIRRRAVIERPLDGTCIQGGTVALRKIRLPRHINAPFLTGSPYLHGLRIQRPVRDSLDPDRILRVRLQPFQRDVCPGHFCPLCAVQSYLIADPLRTARRIPLPVQRCRPRSDRALYILQITHFLCTSISA